jgi:hypothetical protein
LGFSFSGVNPTIRSMTHIGLAGPFERIGRISIRLASTAVDRSLTPTTTPSLRGLMLFSYADVRNARRDAPKELDGRSLWIGLLRKPAKQLLTVAVLPVGAILSLVRHAGAGSERWLVIVASPLVALEGMMRTQLVAVCSSNQKV